MHMRPEEILERFSPQVDAALEEALRQIHPEIADITRYFLGWLDESFKPVSRRSGKKLRPTLALLVHEAITGSAAPAIPLAVTLELIHNYTLIHDDIEDHDAERRGRPTVWRLWGESVAINAGDTLHALAFRTFLDGNPRDSSAMLEVYRTLVETSCRLCEGQHLDITFEKVLDIDQERYLQMIGRKTAALIACSTFGGARLATDDERLVSAYQGFGTNLGYAFQIRDDFLNLWGDRERVGKDQYSDLRSKKKTLPVVYALAGLADERGERLRAIYAATDRPMQAAEMRYVLGLLEDLEAREYTADLVNQYIDAALACLDRTGISNTSQTQLHTLARFLVGRDY
jgi:geranylgeranyl diphosphate synthase type I